MLYLFAASNLFQQLEVVMTCLFKRASLVVLVFSLVGVIHATSAEAGNNGFKRTYYARRFQSPGSTVMLNPQPLPPKVYINSGNFGGNVMLNPQPLPPRWKVQQQYLVR
jgi:hypothetical protein